MIHCGDVVGANTLRPLLEFSLPIHVVHGDNLCDSVALANLSTMSNGLIHYHGLDADLTRCRKSY